MTENKTSTYRYLRRNEQVKYVMEHGYNPRYLPQVKLDPLFIFRSDNVHQLLSRSKNIISAVPNEALQLDYNCLDPSFFKIKIVVSTIKKQ